MGQLGEDKIEISIAILQKVSKLALGTYSKLTKHKIMFPTNEELRCISIIKEFSDGKITIDQAEQLSNAIVGMTEGIERIHSIIRREYGQTMEALSLENQRLRLELSTIKHKEGRRNLNPKNAPK